LDDKRKDRAQHVKEKERKPLSPRKILFKEKRGDPYIFCLALGKVLIFREREERMVFNHKSISF